MSQRGMGQSWYGREAGPVLALQLRGSLQFDGDSGPDETAVERAEA